MNHLKLLVMGTILLGSVAWAQRYGFRSVQCYSDVKNQNLMMEGDYLLTKWATYTTPARGRAILRVVDGWCVLGPEHELPECATFAAFHYPKQPCELRPEDIPPGKLR